MLGDSRGVKAAGIQQPVADRYLVANVLIAAKTHLLLRDDSGTAAVHPSASTGNGELR
jgi:hypothetical protein